MRRIRRSLGMLAILLGFGLLFWLTAVVMSSLPNSYVVAVNVHGLNLPAPDSGLRPAPLSLSVLDDADQDQATAVAPAATPIPHSGRTPIIAPAPSARVPAPSPTGSGLPVPLPSPVITPSASPAAATISGQVTDSQTHLAIVGATISASPSGASTTTDVNGNYSLGVAAGTYTVTASDPTYNSASQSVTVKPGQQQTLSFRLVSITAYGTLTGTVLDAITRAPIAGATVMLSNNLIRTTDLNGNFSYAIVLNGTYTLTVSALGYSAQSQQVTIRPGKTTTVQVALSA